MPTFNAVSRGRLGIGMAKALNMESAGALPTLAPDISGVVQLPIAAEELMAPSGIARWTGLLEQTAVVGEANRYQIRNPPGSGAMIIIERIFLGTAAASDRWLGDWGFATTTDLASGALNVGDFRDGRLRPRATGALVWSSGSAVAILTGIAGSVRAVGTAASGTQAEFPGGPWILVPGNAMLFGSSNANTGGDFMVVWRERGATSSELSLV